MRKWRQTITLKDLWRAYESGQLTARQLTTEVASRLRAHSDVPDELPDRFENVESLKEFDFVLDDLYDWADRERVWISTI